MRLIRLVAATAAALALTTTANAGQHGKPTTMPVHPSAPTHATAPTTHATAPAGASTHVPHATTPHATTPHASVPKTHVGKTTTTTTTTSGGAAPTTSPTTTTSPIGQKIASKPQLSARIQALLPAGTNLQTAAAGFRNQGQFIAAVHVSKNLGIPFDQLKTEMVTNHLSLGQSIQKLRPTADSTTAVHDAETETADDVKVGTTTTSSTTTTTPTTSKKHGSR